LIFLEALSSEDPSAERQIASFVALGPLPPGAPPVCEMFRHYPDALERATELDAQHGSNSPLDEIPMYGVVFSFKDPFDTKDMRTTAGGDAAYDIDFPAGHHILVEQLRRKGAIIFPYRCPVPFHARQAGRSPGPATNYIRAGHQLQDRQGARPHDPAINHRPRRRDHRMSEGPGPGTRQRFVHQAIAPLGPPRVSG
jgi:hypothetical protein